MAVAAIYIGAGLVNALLKPEGRKFLWGLVCLPFTASAKLISYFDKAPSQPRVGSKAFTTDPMILTEGENQLPSADEKAAAAAVVARETQAAPLFERSFGTAAREAAPRNVSEPPFERRGPPGFAAGVRAEAK